MSEIAEIPCGRQEVTPPFLRWFGVRLYRRLYKVTKAYRYFCGEGKSGLTLWVDNGFIYDKASTPWFVWWILPPDGPYGRGPVLHDVLYRKQTLSRFLADAIFRDAMRADGVSLLLCWVLWASVRLGGAAAWAKNKEALDGR